MPLEEIQPSFLTFFFCSSYELAWNAESRQIHSVRLIKEDVPDATLMALTIHCKPMANSPRFLFTVSVLACLFRNLRFSGTMRKSHGTRSAVEALRTHF